MIPPSAELSVRTRCRDVTSGDSSPTRRVSLQSLVVLCSVAFAMSACRDHPASPSVGISAVRPYCSIACGGTDPNPNAPGVYLGGLDNVECLDGVGTDADHYGLEDLCENVLAPTFAPELVLCNCDGGTGREPHWVAAPTGTGYNVRIGYLLSYYRDWGSSDPNCPFDCAGHAGDSESIWLDVTYNADTHHWVLYRANLSAHDGYNLYSQGPGGYAAGLDYPSHLGAYPRVWVSIDKHANYGSYAECDAGEFGFDNCGADTYERVSADGITNLGSRAHQFRNCVNSTNPLYSGDGKQECYWTGARFAGWQTFQPDTDPYSPKLTYFGF
jgi:hypothetical protein